MKLRTRTIIKVLLPCIKRFASSSWPFLVLLSMSLKDALHTRSRPYRMTLTSRVHECDRIVVWPSGLTPTPMNACTEDAHNAISTTAAFILPLLRRSRSSVQRIPVQDARGSWAMSKNSPSVNTDRLGDLRRLVFVSYPSAVVETIKKILFNPFICIWSTLYLTKGSFCFHLNKCTVLVLTLVQLLGP